MKFASNSHSVGSDMPDESQQIQSKCKPRLLRFAHMADLHLGGWRDPELRKMSIQAFDTAVDICIRKNVDFVIVAGDMFDTSLPGFDVLEKAAARFKEMVDKGIRIYVISGSHDFSPSGKTMIKVLENTGLFRDIAITEDGCEFTEDETGAKLIGVMGRKGALERSFFEGLDKNIGKGPGVKIFVFHSAIEEFKPEYLKEMEAMPLSMLPEGFDYYAAGHVHVRREERYGKGVLVYPGPLFPCDFRELEELGFGSFYIVEADLPCENERTSAKVRETVKASMQKLEIFAVETLNYDADGKSAREAEEDLMKKLPDVKDKILLIRVKGTLKEGKPTDINFEGITQKAKEKGAKVVRKNINKLTSREYEELEVKTDSVESIEKQVVKEHLGQMEVDVEDEGKFVKEVMNAMDIEKSEGETVADFEKRVLERGEKIMEA